MSGYPNTPTYAGQDVSAVQRSSTHPMKSESLMELALGDLYSEKAVANGVDTERADLIFASLPYRIMADAVKPAYDEARIRDKECYDGLRATGLDLDFGVDDSGLFRKYLRRGSGNYIDVGAGQLVIDGRIPVAHGQIDHLTEDAVVLDDGTSLPRGCGRLRHGVPVDGRVPRDAHLTGGGGPASARWGATARTYSQFLALQLKARYAGLDNPVYGLQKSHHKR